MHGSKDSDGWKLKITETLSESAVSWWNSSGIFSQDEFAAVQVKILLLRLDESPESFTGRIIFMSTLNDISCGKKDNGEYCLTNANFFFFCIEIWKKDTGHSLVLVLKRSGSVSVKTAHNESGTKLQKGCCWISLGADVQFPCHDSMSRGWFRNKDVESCWYTLQPTRKRLRLFSLNCFCQPGQSLRSNLGDVWWVRLHSYKACQVRSTFGWWWPGQKIFFCSKLENELKSDHNKTN